MATGVASSSAIAEAISVPAISGQTYSKKLSALSIESWSEKTSGARAGRDSATRKTATKAKVTRMRMPAVRDRPEKTLSPAAPPFGPAVSELFRCGSTADSVTMTLQVDQSVDRRCACGEGQGFT